MLFVLWRYFPATFVAKQSRAFGSIDEASRSLNVNAYLVYTNPRLGSDELAAMYSATLYFNAASDKIGYQDYDAAAATCGSVHSCVGSMKISHHAPRPGKLLDVGCATGLFLEVARNRGWDVTASSSTFAAEKARSKGFRIIGTRLGETDWSNETFDLVTMFDTMSISLIRCPERLLFTKFLRQVGSSPLLRRTSPLCTHASPAANGFF